MEGDPQVPANAPLDTPGRWVSLLLSQLMNYGSYDRAPKGFRESWQAVQQANKDSTPRIFFDAGGFHAWFAYLITKNSTESSRHFSGKSECTQLIAELEDEPIQSRKLLAEQLALCVAGELKTNVSRLCHRLNLSEDESMRGSHKRCRTAAEDADMTLSPNNLLLNPIPGQVEHAPVEPSDTNHTASALYPPECAPEAEQILVNASLAVAVKIFPEGIGDAIVRHSKSRNMVASISMSFPNALLKERIGCHMAIELSHEKAPRFIQALFKVDLETRAGLRYVCLPDGAEIVPNPHFTFRQCQRNAILTIFGPEVSNAIFASPGYQEEERQYRSKTESVWGVVSQGAEESVMINLSLGLWEGTQISEKLFPRLQ